jgi:hypothetical protein
MAIGSLQSAIYRIGQRDNPPPPVPSLAGSCAPPLEALRRQRPLPDGALIIVNRGEKKDEGGIIG